MAFIFFLRFYLFIFRRRGWEGESKGEKHLWATTHMCSVRGPNLQPRHVLSLGIEPATLWLAWQCPTNWATLARAGIMALGFRNSYLTARLCHIGARLSGAITAPGERHRGFLAGETGVVTTSSKRSLETRYARAYGPPMADLVRWMHAIR